MLEVSGSGIIISLLPIPCFFCADNEGGIKGLLKVYNKVRAEIILSSMTSGCVQQGRLEFIHQQGRLQSFTNREPFQERC